MTHIPISNVCHVAGRMRDRGRADSNVWIGIVTALSVIPFGIAAPLMPSGGSSLALVCCYLFCGAMPYGGAAAAFQEITPNRMRGQVSAIYLFWLNLAGIGLGPTIVALASAHLYGGDLGIGRAIATVIGVCSTLAATILFLCTRPYRRAMTESVGAVG